MVSIEKPHLKQQPEEIAQLALWAFWKIMDAWCVDDNDQISLLGIKTDLSTERLKEIHISSISFEVLERISLVVKIDMHLSGLFPTQEKTNAWVHKCSNTFGGISPLGYILCDVDSGLLKVMEYLNTHLPLPKLATTAQDQKKFILSLIVDWAGSEVRALKWYEMEIIPALGMTPQQAIEQGQYAALLEYIEIIKLGGFA
jgi:hypothetical protein